jgi:cholesterol oxidase
MIQEGAIPRALALPLRLLGPVVARVTRLPADTSFDWRFAHLRRELDSLIRGGRHGALARTQTFLVMGHDDGAGTLTLARDALRIGWNTLERQKVFKAIQARLFMLTQAMGGRYVMNPFWTRLFGRRLLTVHPLGGCAMADTPEHGVVNGMGRVFSSGSGTDFHSNLYVCDGSIVPHALGTNPALTIAALAERIAKGAPLPASLGSDVSAPSRVDASVTGIEYAERLRGWLRLDGQPTRLQLVLHISAPSVDDLIGRRRDGGTEKSAKRPAPPGRTDESRETPETEAARDRRSATTAGPADRPGSDADRHQASVIGVAWTPDLDGERRRWTVSQGTLNVLVHDPRLVDTRLLVYHLKLTSASGERFWIHGHKTINLETCRRHPWRAVTTFSFRAYRPERSNEGRPGCGHTLPIEDDEQFGRLCDWVEWIEKDMPGRVPAGEGRVRAGTADVARMIGSVRITDAPGWSAKVAAASRLAAYFLDVWIQALAWPLQRTVRIDPFQPVQVKVPGSVVTRKGDIIEGCETDAGLIPYRLTPYSSKGRAPAGDPVILAPGFGMNADAFLVGRPSLVEFLIERNYDPWLLDYRGSDHLEISLTQFTLDDLVGDFEEAIRKLYRKSQRPVRIIAHCVASLATTMALLTREGLGDCVHSVILSQSFAFMDHPWLNRVKAHLRLPQLLRFLGVDSVLTADLDLRSPFWARVLDRLLHFYPTVEQCSSGVCRRLLFLYGEVVRHENLDRRTHDMLYELFDRANLTTFVHLARMIRSGHIVDRHGRNAYLVAENGRRLTMPITLLQGRRNRLFRPAGGRLTHEWLLEHGYDRDRAENERRFALDVIDGYGHLDNFIGKRAHEHVFPELIRLLARMDEVRGGVAAGK